MHSNCKYVYKSPRAPTGFQRFSEVKHAVKIMIENMEKKCIQITLLYDRQWNPIKL